VALAVVSAMMFAGGSAATKLLVSRFPTTEVAFLRVAIGLVLLGTSFIAFRHLREARDLWGHLWRGVLGTAAVFSLTQAYALAPLGLVQLTFFSRVLMMPLWSYVLLGERFTGRLLVAVGVGAAGLLLASWPTLNFGWEPGLLWAVAGAVFSAGSQTFVRRLAASNAACTIALAYSAFATLALGVIGPAVGASWFVPEIADGAGLVLLGGCALMAQIAAAAAARLAPANILAPLDFLSVPAAALLGLLWHEVPTIQGIAGSILVFIAASVVITVDPSRIEPPKWGLAKESERHQN
jgi:drug/metabolite transporter (DMT)-like permease